MSELLSTIVNGFKPSRQEPVEFKTTEALTDGIYAIAATLLVLELHPSGAGAGELAHGLREEWFKFLVYGVGFFQIIGGWNLLRRARAWAPMVDYYVVLLTMGVLVPFALAPFTLGLIAESRGNADDLATAVRVAAGAYFFASATYAIMCGYVRGRGYIRTDLEPQVVGLALKLVWVGPLLPALSFALAPFAGLWATAPLLLTVAFCLLPFEPRTLDGR